MKAKKYLLFFLLGYCIYIAIEVTYRGYSFRLMGIAGGLSLAGIGMLEDAGLRRFPLAFQMMVSAVLITAIELYSGMFSLRVLHYRMWDYSALPFSFCDGLICPWFFGIWYLLSVVGIFLTDYVSYYIFHAFDFFYSAVFEERFQHFQCFHAVIGTVKFIGAQSLFSWFKIDPFFISVSLYAGNESFFLQPCQKLGNSSLGAEKGFCKMRHGDLVVIANVP